MWHVWSKGNVPVWVEFWDQDMQACGMCGAKEIYWFGWSFGTWTCKRVTWHRKCSCLGGTQEMYWFGWSFETRIFKHVACMEHRKCTGLGGVLGPGHASM